MGIRAEIVIVQSSSNGYTSEKLNFKLNKTNCCSITLSSHFIIPLVNLNFLVKLDRTIFFLLRKQLFSLISAYRAFEKIIDPVDPILLPMYQGLHAPNPDYEN